MAAYNETSATPYYLRDRQHLERCFAGLQLIGPGVVSLSQWQPGPIAIEAERPVAADGGVARKR